MKQRKHTTSWLLKYTQQIQNLQRMRVGTLSPEVIKVGEKIFAPVIADPATANWEQIAEEWWNLERDAEIATARKEVAVQLRLRPLYERLKTATSQEWEVYAKLVSKTRFMVAKPLFQALLKSHRTKPTTG